MRNQDQPTSPNPASARTIATPGGLPRQAGGQHRRGNVIPLIPVQVTPDHDRVDSPSPAPSAQAPAQPTNRTAEPADQTSAAPTPESTAIPHVARWKASRAPRMLAVVLLLLAVAGTSGLALRYEQDPGTDQLIALAIGIGVVVVLWGLLIASTPQVVSLRGSVITVRNSSGTERFDLGDGLQPVDLVGEPKSSSWALMLHRGDHSSLVLRRRDVDAVLLDRVVRHYRAIAARRFAERQVRFNR